MSDHPVAVSLPIEDRRSSFEFYREALGLVPIGEPAEDGVPEPLQFALNNGAHLVLVPTGGFDWVVGDHEVAAQGHSECLLRLTVDTDDEVTQQVACAERAGATIVSEPSSQPWGYSGLFADPDGHLWMVTTAASSSTG